ncbi:MAG: hypothetical protein HYY42_04770 [Chloroflexi bacterium]|nr:hypothetical protein [Chloroflexota bacterium]MBI2983475.1 hypothetical protein [Chloroflexota bacterium]
MVRPDPVAGSGTGRLGGVIAITDNSQSGPIPYYEKRLDVTAAAPAPATQIPVGDLEIVVRVQVQFAIQ